MKLYDAINERERGLTLSKNGGRKSQKYFFLTVFFIGFFFLASASHAFAATRYWVGGGSSNTWAATGPTNWAATSGGANNASVPGSSDDVFFDSSTSTPSVLSANITVNSLDMTGYTGTLTHNAAVTLTIAGNGVVFKLAPGMTYTLGAATAALNFTGTSGTTTITTAGKTVGNITFNGTGGWQLQDTLISTSTITLTLGDLDTKSQTITAQAFSSSNSNNRILTLGSSSITLTSANAWTTTNTNLTYSTNTAVVTFTANNANLNYASTGANTNFNGLSLVFNLVNDNSPSISGGNFTATFSNLTINGAANKNGLFVLTNANITLTGTFTVNANSSVNRILIGTGVLSSAGTNHTITAANVLASSTDFEDITGAGTANWDLSAIPGGSGDAGGNSGITFTASTTEYWVRNSGNWSGQNWSASSGGATTTGRVPLPQDTARFDSNSFTTTGQTVTADMLRMGRNIDWTGVTNNPLWAKTLGGINAYYLFGSVTMVPGMTNSGSLLIYLYGRGSTTWTSAGQPFTNPINIMMPGGTLTLQDNFTSSSTLTLTKGTLNANNYNVTATAILSNNSNTRTLTMGSGIWNMTGTGTVWDFTATSSLTLNANTATTTISNTSSTAKTFIGGGLTWNNVNFSGDNITATSSNTFNTFAVNNAGLPNGLKLASGLTQTVSNFITNGSSGNLAKLVSTGSTAAILFKIKRHSVG